MDIDVAQTLSHQMVSLDKLEDLIVSGLRCQREGLQERKDFSSILNSAAGKFADDERVADHLSVIQQPFKVGLPLSKMMHPYRGVY